MLTAASIIEKAKFNSKGHGYDVIALDLLNAVLTDICLYHDLALARSLFTFNFNPGLTSNFGSGPYTLPLDYLRASGSSGEGQKTFFWTLNGVPYPMVPCDLSEFDMQVQQAGLQSYPWLWATDLGGPQTQRITLVTTALTTSGNVIIIPATGVPSVGQGVAGEGIVPGTLVSAVATTLSTTGRVNTTTTLDNLGSTFGVRPGDSVTGPDIPPNTVVVTVDSPTQVTMSQASTAIVTPEAVTFTYQLSIVTLSQAATSTNAAASIFFGIPPVAYAYPPPSGAYPVSIRYQRQMPMIIDTSLVPWFPDEGYLIDELTGRLMDATDDSRAKEFLSASNGRAAVDMRKYLMNANDKKNRPQTVELDRRRFGPSFRSLPNTKTVGWTVLLTFGLQLAFGLPGC